ncbi:MAG TPA: LamG domain-containing protein [archaeon]|nr:LamG domain-containing protein [archaeon]
MKYVFLAILLFASVATAHTVTMNFALNVGGNNNTIRVNDTTYSGNVANSSVMLLMHLDNSTLDSSAYGNNGIAGGVNCTGVVGRANGACSFDGIDDNITIAHSSTINLSSQLSVSLWVKLNQLKNHNFLVAKGYDNSENYEIYVNSAGQVMGEWKFASGRATCVNSVDTLQTDVWYHIAVTYNNSVCKTYINSVLKNESFISGDFQTNSRPLIIGGEEDPGGGFISARFANGTIDEVVLWNRSLSSEEVYSLYSYGLSEPTSLTFTSMSKNYISSSRANTTTALVSAGTLLNMRMNNSYNSTHYLMQVTQDNTDNRILFAVTNGSYTDVENKLSMVNAFRMVSSTFGNFITTAPTVFPLFIRLEYTAIDIDSRIDWSGTGQLRIKNNGVNNRNIPNLTLEVVR